MKEMTEKFVKLTTGNVAEVLEIPAVEDKELDSSFNDFVHSAIDCDTYQAVDTSATFKDIMMLVDEEGKWNYKDVNKLAWFIFNTCNPIDHIVGDVLFCGIHRVGEYDELDFRGLTEDEIENIMDHIRRFKILFGMR